MQPLVLYIAAIFIKVVHEGWAFPIGIGLELLFPMFPGQKTGILKGVALWMIYWLVAAGFFLMEGRGFRLLGLHPILRVGAASPWIVPAVIGSLIVGDFFYYWCHRLQHTPLLWRFHAVHHSIRDMGAANSYHHWTEAPLHFLLPGIPMVMLFDVTGQIAETFASLAVLQTVYIHTPTRLSIGPLSKVFVDNRFHRHHHIRDERRSGYNFAIFTTLWDRLFRTAYFPAKEEWCEVGLAEYPEVEKVTAFIFPGRPS